MVIWQCKFWAVVRVDVAREDDGTICERDTTAYVVGIFEPRFKEEANLFAIAKNRVADDQL